jgi:hemerythrin-like domain-containing protein
MKITEVLMAEHAVFHNLFDHIEKVLPGLKTVGEVKGLAGVMETVLLVHARVEDELLITPLEHCLEHLGQRENFHQDHVEIDQNLKRIQEARDIREARQLLHAAVLFSRNHFDKEERFVFPMAEKWLKPSTVEDLGKACLAQRNALVAA